jgi:hypothetical protein
MDLLARFRYLLPLVNTILPAVDDERLFLLPYPNFGVSHVPSPLPVQVPKLMVTLELWLVEITCQTIGVRTLHFV